MTSRTLIKASLRKLGVLAVGEQPSADEAMDALHALNLLLEAWNTDGLSVYATSRAVVTLTADDGEYSIGSGGDIDVVQPIRIHRAAVIAAGSTREAPVEILTQDEWAQRQDKTTTGLPYQLHLQRGIAAGLGALFLYPIPADAHTLVLYLGSQLAAIPENDAGLSTDYELPPGYGLALEAALAVVLAPEFGVSVSPELATIATGAYAQLKRSNLEPATMRIDEALSGCGGRWDINTGGFIQ